MIILGLLLASLLGLPLVSSQGGTSKIYFENENFAIQITGNQNVPQYQFWRPSDNLTINETTKYQVKFTKVFEFIDEDGDGGFSPGNDTMVPHSTDALASMSWEFGDIVTDADNVTHFNISSTGRDYFIQFRNHFDPLDSSLKFDIIIENYVFTSDHENASLGLGFHLVSTLRDMNQVRSQIQFGNDGFFEAVEEAKNGNETIAVKLSNGEETGDNMAYLAFPKFTGNIEYDPIIGFLTQEFDESEHTGITDDSTDDDANSGKTDNNTFSIPGYSMIAFTLILLGSSIMLVRKSKLH